MPRVIEGGVEVNNFQHPGPLPILPTSNGNGEGGKGGGDIAPACYCHSTPQVDIILSTVFCTMKAGPFCRPFIRLDEVQLK